MHQVIASYLRRFVTEYSYEALPEDQQFERFVNYIVISRYFPDEFEVDEVTTSESDQSIDGAAVLIGDDLILSAEAATAAFSRLKARQQASVTYVFIQSKRTEGFDAGEILKFGSGVKRLFDPASDQPNDDLLRELRAIHQIVVENLGKVESGRPSCELYFATTGVWMESNGLDVQTTYVEGQLRSTSFFREVAFYPSDREKIISLWLSAQSTVEATILVKQYIPLPEISGVNEAYLALAPAVSFVTAVLTEPEGRIRASVFDQNVRAYLGDENPINKSMYESLKDAASHDRFAILNNGITIVSPDVRVQSDRIRVSDYQIVNGCQTSHVLFRSKQVLSEKVILPLRIIEAQDPEIVAQIVAATNSQSEVSQSQFLSIRPFVRKLEVFFNSFDSDEEKERRLYFERRTRQYVGQEIKKMRIFDIQKLARAFAAMFLDVPHLAAGFPTQTFQEKADSLFQPEHRELAYYTAAFALYRLELSLGNNYVPRKYQRFKWHLLMLLRYQQGGADLPGLRSKKLDDYCKRILSGLAEGGKTAAEPFMQATRIIDAIGEASKDRLKRARYTEELLAMERGDRK
jgi:hypothetical protein